MLSILLIRQTAPCALSVLLTDHSQSLGPAWALPCHLSKNVICLVTLTTHSLSYTQLSVPVEMWRRAVCKREGSKESDRRRIQHAGTHKVTVEPFIGLFQFDYLYVFRPWQSPTLPFCLIRWPLIGTAVCGVFIHPLIHSFVRLLIPSRSQEIFTAVVFLAMVLLWLTRSPGFMPGWASLFPQWVTLLYFIYIPPEHQICIHPPLKKSPH